MIFKNTESFVKINKSKEEYTTRDLTYPAKPIWPFT
jgi:hypothetical protein